MDAQVSSALYVPWHCSCDLAMVEAIVRAVAAPAAASYRWDGFLLSHLAPAAFPGQRLFGCVGVGKKSR